MFVVRARRHKKCFVFSRFDDGAEGEDVSNLKDEDAVVEEVFSYFSYVNVAIPQYTNTPLQVKIIFSKFSIMTIAPRFQERIKCYYYIITVHLTCHYKI